MPVSQTLRVRLVYQYYLKAEIDRFEAWELTRTQQIPGAPWGPEIVNPWRKCHTETHWGYMRGQLAPLWAW